MSYVPAFMTQLIEQKGMTFDHDFGYFLPLFSSLLQKRGKKKRRMKSKNRVQSHAILLDRYNSIILLVYDFSVLIKSKFRYSFINNTPSYILKATYTEFIGLLVLIIKSTILT